MQLRVSRLGHGHRTVSVQRIELAVEGRAADPQQLRRFLPIAARCSERGEDRIRLGGARDVGEADLSFRVRPGAFGG